jgi:queuine/archaeosine tRNA-ribosyltransferase
MLDSRSRSYLQNIRKADEEVQARLLVYSSVQAYLEAVAGMSE